VEQLTVLVTSEGRWVLPGSEEFLAAVGDLDPDFDAVGFAVRNLGFIKYQVLDRLVTEIELHPRNVAPAALLAVERRLDKPSTKLFRIKHLATEWRSEIFASPEHSVARLRELCVQQASPPRSERFVAELKDHDALSRQAALPLRVMAQKWRTSFGCFDSSVISFAMERNLLPRIMIAGVGPRASDDPVFRFIGGGLTAMGDSYHFEGIGRKLRDVPDRDYGEWVAHFYKAVADSGQPRYDIVTAAIRDPAGAGEPEPIRYERLLLPWKTGSDEVLVTLASKRLSPSPEPEPEFASLVGGERSARKLVKSS
jgi:hypothetical protein